MAPPHGPPVVPHPPQRANRHKRPNATQHLVGHQIQPASLRPGPPPQQSPAGDGLGGRVEGWVAFGGPDAHSTSPLTRHLRNQRQRRPWKARSQSSRTPCHRTQRRPPSAPSPRATPRAGRRTRHQRRRRRNQRLRLAIHEACVKQGPRHASVITCPTNRAETNEPVDIVHANRRNEPQEERHCQDNRCHEPKNPPIT